MASRPPRVGNCCGREQVFFHGMGGELPFAAPMTNGGRAQKRTWLSEKFAPALDGA